MRSCPPSPEWTAHEISHVYRSLVVHLHDGSVGLSRAAGPRPWAHFPRSCRDLYHTSRQLGDAAQYTARRPAPRLAAAGRLPILGRLWAPDAFLGVPQERPAKHQPGHYRRGEPGGQADQHPRPRAHPAPQAAHPGHWPCPLPITRPAVPIRYGRTPPRALPYVTRSHRGRYHTDRQPNGDVYCPGAASPAAATAAPAAPGTPP